jgi:cytochrome c
MKKLIAISAAMLVPALLFGASAQAEDGAAIFQAKGCVACHDATQDRTAQGLGPSLQQVAAAYKGDQAGLVAFLKGEGEPKVAPDKYPIMKSQLAITQALTDAERDALAQFLLSH